MAVYELAKRDGASVRVGTFTWLPRPRSRSRFSSRSELGAAAAVELIRALGGSVELEGERLLVVLPDAR